ncbi:Daunorubicin/doxorubicin resistance ATP-binding protein DrrA [Actinomadura rubteroloni]|uniref:Transport permease protein n=1 Tax=Actinomadura rubteroloni TaxID=1926885 RepID=A0A2P4UCW0_9ACTN|nr:ATP-binding cassette domain-containing protein [Actinomadura rubteroloni]POM22895.1 Daunorubicin/doxorubicin resistance ATP-binding protein DrrA [Actinomadura rubteroloni]
MSVRPDAPPAPAVTGPPAIRARGLTKRYPDVTAVDGLDLSVAAGESFGFLGPNGAGKSTTIAMLCTLAVPTAGTVEIDGHDTRTDAVAARRSIGLIFQESTLDGELTAAENLRFHADLYDIPVALVPGRVDETLALVGLSDARDRFVRTFSGGMRRRLEIARALLHRPRILFMDEPTIGLDPQSRAQVWRYLHRIRERETVTLFLTTHYLDEAEQCDRVAILDAGRIVAQGSPAELKAVLGADRVDLRTDDDAAAARLLRTRFGLTVAEAPDGLSFTATDSARILPRLFAELDVPVYEARVTPPTLDDVFLHHTGHRIRAEGPADPSGDDAPPPVPAPRPAPEVASGGVRAELRALRMVWRREMLHFLRDRAGTVISLFQPLLFLFILGVGLAGLMAGPSSRSYQVFLFSGALVTASQAPALRVGSALLWDRRSGFLREMLAGPVHRGTLLLGTCLGGTTVATCQAGLLLGAGAVIGVPPDPGLLVLLAAELALTALAMTVLGVLLAMFVRPQTYGTALTVLMAPLMFLSGSVFPLSAMPGWMEAVALVNPFTYAVDAMHRTMAVYLTDAPASLFAPVAWGSWHPPVVLEALLPAGLAALGLMWAARRFSRLD